MNYLAICFTLLASGKWEFVIALPMDSLSYCQLVSDEVNTMFLTDTGERKVLCVEDKRIQI